MLPKITLRLLDESGAERLKEDLGSSAHYMNAILVIGFQLYLNNTAARILLGELSHCDFSGQAVSGTHWRRPRHIVSHAGDELITKWIVFFEELRPKQHERHDAGGDDAIKASSLGVLLIKMDRERVVFRGKIGNLLVGDDERPYSPSLANMEVFKIHTRIIRYLRAWFTCIIPCCAKRSLRKAGIVLSGTSLYG